MAVTINPRVKTLQAHAIKTLAQSLSVMSDLLEATRDAGVMEKELSNEALRAENARLRVENVNMAGSIKHLRAVIREMGRGTAKAKPRKGRGGGPATG